MTLSINSSTSSSNITSQNMQVNLDVIEEAISKFNPEAINFLKSHFSNQEKRITKLIDAVILTVNSLKYDEIDKLNYGSERSFDTTNVDIYNLRAFPLKEPKISIRNGQIAAYYLDKLVMLCAINTNAEALKELLDAGAKVDATDYDKDTALTRASWEGNIKVVELLQERGANVNARSSQNRTPLMLAAMFSQTEVIEFLINHRAFINAVDDKANTALVYACEQKKLETVKVLYNAYKNISQKEKDDALIAASGSGHALIIDFLLDRGANINCRSYLQDTPLMVAVHTRKLNSIIKLLQRNADFTLTDGMDNTALMIAQEIINEKLINHEPYEECEMDISICLQNAKK